MDDIQKKRPTGITVIGWIFIASALLVILLGVKGFADFTIKKQADGGIPPGLIAMVLGVLAIFVIIASIQFLILRRWARTALEVIAWMGLVYVVGFGIFELIMWITTYSFMWVSEGGASGPLSVSGISFAVIISVVTICCAGPLIVIIKFLRKKTIREAVS
jgi:hypothetical protein